MILDFNSFSINESSLKKLKKELHGVLNRDDRKKMRYLLKDNIITFKFRKRNGDLRTAHGTLHSDYLPPSRGGSPKPDKQMVYYDLDKGGWRSFRSYTFIKIVDIKSIEDFESSTEKSKKYGKYGDEKKKAHIKRISSSDESEDE